MNNYYPCESPIEKSFYDKLPAHIKRFTKPQFVIGKYRADFAIPLFRLIIEADGKEFHEKNFQADRLRDRELLAQGWTTVRFTGSEIYNDVDSCIAFVTLILNKRWYYPFWTILG